MSFKTMFFEAPIPSSAPYMVGRYDCKSQSINTAMYHSDICHAHAMGTTNMKCKKLKESNKPA